MTIEKVTDMYKLIFGSFLLICLMHISVAAVMVILLLRAKGRRTAISPDPSHSRCFKVFGLRQSCNVWRVRPCQHDGFSHLGMRVATKQHYIDIILLWRILALFGCWICFYLSTRPSSKVLNLSFSQKKIEEKVDQLALSRVYIFIHLFLHIDVSTNQILLLV